MSAELPAAAIAAAAEALNDGLPGGLILDDGPARRAAQRALEAATAAIPASGQPVLVAAFVDCRCTHFRCDEPDVYRMIGGCYNCGTSPILGLFSAGHQKGGGKCPACGCDRLHWDRLATPDEIPAEVTP